jgi:putative NADH-flavin reductase
MKVLVLGASGKTGALVVERALAEGHQVTVLVRDSTKLSGNGYHVIAGDATVPGDILRAVEGVDAVIDTIGGPTPYKDTTLERKAAQNTIEAMQANHIRRLIVVSMMGIGSSSEQAPFWYEHLLMPTFLRGSTKDKEAMEQEVHTSNLDFVIARPPILKDDPPTGSVMILEGDVKGHQITRGDLADFLVDQLASDQYVGQAVTVVNS